MKKTKEVQVMKSFTMQDCSDERGHRVAIVLYDKNEPAKSSKAVVTMWSEDEITELMDRISDDFLDKWYTENNR